MTFCRIRSGVARRGCRGVSATAAASRAIRRGGAILRRGGGVAGRTSARVAGQPFEHRLESCDTLFKHATLLLGPPQCLADAASELFALLGAAAHRVFDPAAETLAVLVHRAELRLDLTGEILGVPFPLAGE
jgi:hypothetical protein